MSSPTVAYTASCNKPSLPSAISEASMIIRRFERGFFQFDSTAEKDIVALSKDQNLESSYRPLVYLYAAMVHLWGRRTRCFDAASKLFNFLKEAQQAGEEKGGAGFTPKEKAHFEALQLFLSRNFDGVVDHYGSFLKDHSPDDTVALRMLILAQFFQGNTVGKVFDVFESVKETNWGCATFISYYCMSGSFSGKVAPSQLDSMMIEASNLAPDRFTVQHATMHVQVRRPLEELIDYLEKAVQSWGDDVGQAYRSHGFFHLSLLYAFNGEAEKAKSFFYSEIWPRDNPCRSAMLVQMNAIGLLWVLHLINPDIVSIQDWDDVAKEVLKEELHLDGLCIMPLIMASYCLHRSGRKTDALESLKVMESRAGGPNATMVGMSLLRGCLSYCDGRYEEASTFMESYASEHDCECIGSSDEQRLPLWFTYISSLSKNPDISENKLRASLTKQVKMQERDMWPIEIGLLEQKSKK